MTLGTLTAKKGEMDYLDGCMMDARIEDNQETTIAHCDGQYADMLAAAPELLAYAECEAAYNAPKATFSTINVVLRKHGWTDAHDRRAWMADLRDAALAKARGQQ